MNEEAWSKGNLEVVDEVYAPSFLINGERMSADTMKQAIQYYRTVFPDLQISVEDLVAEGDTVVYRWVWRGTQHGELTESPFGPIPATGKQVTIQGISTQRYEHGKVVADWFNWDALGLYQQLGVIPTPDQTES